MRPLRMPETELRDRQNELLHRARSDGYDGVVLFGSLGVEYLTGMFHLPTERPAAVGLAQEGVHVVVPKLEEDHARNPAFAVDAVHTYFEYPQSDPMGVVGDMCAALGIADGRIAADADGSPRRNGYEGPALSSVVAGAVEVRDYTTTMRERKSDAEIDFVRTASEWANLGHRILQGKIEPGRRPVVVSQEVQAEASAAMLDTLGDKYVMTDWSPPVTCKFTAGEETYRPHSVDQTKEIREGDNVVSIVKAQVGGYLTELERTMFVGEPSDEQREYFDIVTEAQSIAIDAIAPGVEYAAVENAVLDHYRELGVESYNHHHIGHNIGLDFHERPFLDVGYEGTISEGELYTVEPALFVPGLGGFRHSDTVVVTPDGTEQLTYYPKSIDELVVGV